MSNENVDRNIDGTPSVVVEETRRDSPPYDASQILNQNFLKSSKFLVRLYDQAAVLENSGVSARELSFLCDSVEFPGQSLTTLDYRMPGKLKLKVPYLRDLNEITLTFYHNSKIPIYQFFTNWISKISPTATTNNYFNNITSKIEILQFDDVAAQGFFKDVFGLNQTPQGGLINNLTRYMTVNLDNVYPLNFASMPGNWADEGFHKMSVTFFYESLSIDLAISNLKFKDLVKSGSIVDTPIGNPITSFDYFSTNPVRNPVRTA